MVPKNCGLDEQLLSKEFYNLIVDEEDDCKNIDYIEELDILNEEYSYRRNMLQLEQKSLDKEDDSCEVKILSPKGKKTEAKFWKDVHSFFGEQIMKDRESWLGGSNSTDLRRVDTLTNKREIIRAVGCPVRKKPSEHAHFQSLDKIAE